MRKYLVACLPGAFLFLGGGFTASAEGLHREEVLSLVQDAWRIKDRSVRKYVLRKRLKGNWINISPSDFIEKFVRSECSESRWRLYRIWIRFRSVLYPFFQL